MSDIATQTQFGSIIIPIRDKILSESVGAGAHNSIYRGKFLGNSVTAEQYEAIKSGTFDDLYIGDYWTINNHTYYIAHFDYWLNTGDTACTTHHILVIPKSGNLVSGKMNSTNVTTGAYIGSDFKTGNNGNTALAGIKAIIKADFGASNILTHREYFSNAVTNEYESAGAWYDSDIDLMNEEMVYGGVILGNIKAGTNIQNNHTIDKSQLKLFQERPDLITTRAFWWLRDVVSGADFADVAVYGYANSAGAGNSVGVRPAFAIC